jgi:hypothetical protein
VLATGQHDHGAPMHFKSYQIDGRLLRTGAAVQIKLLRHV